MVSVVIPARNEADNIPETIEKISQEFAANGFDFEIIVVNDGSTDATEEVVRGLSEKDSRVRLVSNPPPFGFGNAIAKGLGHMHGDMAIITMADLSDDPKDMVRYARAIEQGYDCCFGTRWGKGANVEGYPKLKYVLNRVVNGWINMMFGLGYNDVTNAFKCYSRETIDGIRPILSRHFNITVELPLKAIVRGYSYKIIPTGWRERRKGVSKLKLQEMGSRYLFIIIYMLVEKWLTGKDYKKGEAAASAEKEKSAS